MRAKTILAWLVFGIPILFLYAFAVLIDEKDEEPPSWMTGGV